MIYFSYFANWRKFPPNAEQVAICRYPPKGWKGKHLPALAPSRFSEYNSGTIGFSELIEHYRTQLNGMTNLRDMITDNSIYLCYERTECHRFALLEKLLSMGYDCREL